MTIFKSDKITFLVLPLLCELAALFNTVLVSRGYSRVYLFLYAVALIALLIKPSKMRMPLVAAYLYMVCLLLAMIIHLPQNENSALFVFSATLTYLLPILYWIIYYNRYGSNIIELLYALRYPFAIVSILGYVNYFISPDLFGVYTGRSGEMEWAMNQDFESYSEYFRCRSTLGSSQVYGLAMALYSSCFYRFFISSKNIVNILLLLLYLSAGALSGSKSFFLIVGIVFITSVFSKSSKTYIKIFTIIIAVLVFFAINYAENLGFGFASRIVNIDNLGAQERSGRLSRYALLLSNVDFLGAGPGSLQAIGGVVSKSYMAAESYVLQLLYEMGVIPFLFFCYMIIDGFQKTGDKIMFIICVISMFYVHAFGSFIFFVFWAFIILPKPKKQQAIGKKYY